MDMTKAAKEYLRDGEPRPFKLLKDGKLVYHITCVCCDGTMVWEPDCGWYLCRQCWGGTTL